MINVNSPDPNCKTLQQLEIYSLIYNNNFSPEKIRVLFIFL